MGERRGGVGRLAALVLVVVVTTLAGGCDTKYRALGDGARVPEGHLLEVLPRERSDAERAAILGRIAALGPAGPDAHDSVRCQAVLLAFVAVPVFEADRAAIGDAGLLVDWTLALDHLVALVPSDLDDALTALRSAGRRVAPWVTNAGSGGWPDLATARREERFPFLYDLRAREAEDAFEAYLDRCPDH